MDYKDYFLKCRDNYDKQKPILEDLYKDPVRNISSSIFSLNTLKELDSMAENLKKEFDIGKHNMKNILGHRNIWVYEKAIQSACQDLMPYLEEKMFGCNLYVSKVFLYRNKKLDFKEDSYLWHHDNQPHEVTKVIIYLNKVSENNSPFEYLIDEKQRGVLAQCTRLGPENWKSVPNGGRLEKEVENLIKSKKYKTKKVTGEKYTTSVFLNNAIHRANPSIEGYRDVMSLLIMPTIKKPLHYVSKKWTTSYEISVPVNPNPEISWYNFRTNKFYITSKIKNLLLRAKTKLKF